MKPCESRTSGFGEGVSWYPHSYGLCALGSLCLSFLNCKAGRQLSFIQDVCGNKWADPCSPQDTDAHAVVS